MQKVSYMGNGSTTEFYFNFPYFENSNVVVTKNNQTATGYNIIGNSGGLNADIPYTEGKVVFETAPGTQDNITISRNLPLSRIADYQPTVRIEPTILNQDLNYLMEVIKDRKDELDELCTQYSEIADKESTTTLLARIAAIHDEIVAIDAKITALGDVSQIRNNILINTNDITALKGYDYVIESQSPTAENNYTWYRKYKSGWIEQGGKQDFVYNTGNVPQAFSCLFAKSFANSNYTFSVNFAGGWGTSRMFGVENMLVSGMSGFITQSTATTLKMSWYACGISA